MAQKRRIIFIVALLLIVSVLGLFFGGLLSVAPPDYNPKTKMHYEDAIGLNDASGVYFRGYWNDGSGTGQKELLDGPQYATSWKPSGSSEGMVPIAETVFSLGVFKGGGTTPDVPEWRYYTSTGGSWNLVKRTPAGTPIAFGVAKAAFLPPNPLYFLQGPFDGWLRVELVGAWWTPGANIFDGDIVNDLRYEGVFISDDARLVSGRGTITAPTELKVYNVGETISITVDLGTACSKKVSTDGIVSQGSGWILEVFSAGQARTVKTWDLGCGPGMTGVDASGARLQYVVADSDFLVAPGVCENTLQLSLFNELFLKDKTSVKTIDIKKVEKPAAPKIEVTAPGGVWEEGEKVHVKVITSVTGATVNLVVEDANGVELIRVERSVQTEFDFLPTVTGIYTVTASVEVNCGASNDVFFKVTIKDKTPPDTTGGGDDDVPFPLLAVILLLGGIALILLGIFLPVFDIRIKLIFILVGGVSFVIGVLSLTGAL